MILLSKELEDKIDVSLLEISEDELDVRLLNGRTEIVSLDLEKEEIRLESDEFPLHREMSISLFSETYLAKLKKVKRNKNGKFVSTFLINLTEKT